MVTGAKTVGAHPTLHLPQVAQLKLNTMDHSLIPDAPIQYQTLKEGNEVTPAKTKQKATHFHWKDLRTQVRCGVGVLNLLWVHESFGRRGNRKRYPKTWNASDVRCLSLAPPPGVAGFELDDPTTVLCALWICVHLVCVSLRPVPPASPRVSVTLCGSPGLSSSAHPSLALAACSVWDSVGGEEGERRRRGRGEGGRWRLEPGKKEGTEGGRRRRAQGRGGSQLSAHPAASPCRGAAGRDGLARGRPLLLPQPAAPPALRAPPTGEWLRHAGRERGRRPSASQRGLSKRRAPGGVEPLGVPEHRAGASGARGRD